MSGLADSVVARLIEQRDLLQDFNDQCRSIAVQATSRDRSVTVVVDGSGRMTALTLRAAASRLSGDALAEQIVNTVQTAATTAFERRAQLTAQFNQRFHALQQQSLRKSDGSLTTPAEN
jgi:DNA-binding protein YbaB